MGFLERGKRFFNLQSEHRCFFVGRTNIVLWRVFLVLHHLMSFIIECILRNLASDTELVVWGTQRGLDRLETWGCAKLLECNKAKCKVLHLVWGNPMHKNRLGREWIESSPEKTRRCWWMRGWT